MSTRATYSFELDFQPSETQIVSFYIHHDGYPEGAASYFWNMHKAKHYRGGLAERFIKSNPIQCELTVSHEHHEDTEYQYSMSNEGYLTAKYCNYGEEFIVFFEGHYSEFINKYDELCSKDETFGKIYKLKTNSEYLTLKELKNQLIELYTDYLDGKIWGLIQFEVLKKEYKQLAGTFKK